MAADDVPPPPPPPPPGMDRTSTAVPPIEAPPVAPSAPVVTPVDGASAPSTSRPDPYALPAPGYTSPGYGYQPPAYPPPSPYAQPAQSGYGAQPVYGRPGYGQPGYSQPAYAQPYNYAAGPTRGLSIASMVLGLVGLVFGFPFSIAAVITGHIASRTQPYGKGMWLTGIITGYIVIGLTVLGALLFLIVIALYPNAA